MRARACASMHQPSLTSRPSLVLTLTHTLNPRLHQGVMSGYVDRNVDLDKLFETAVNSMLSTLDPYSTYENVDESANLNMRTTGRYGGVGLTIGKDADGRVLVLNALEGFAYDAGVRPGDRIFAIDGQPVAPLSVDQVKDKLRGEPGTTLAITVERDGAIEKTLTMPLPRKLVRLPDVTLAAVDAGGVGYIKLEGFSEGTAEEMGRAITRLQAERELPALVLDMRDNPGGLLDAAVAVSQQLVPEGTEIVSTAGRVYGEGASLSYRSTKPPLLSPRTRLVVLVNGNTASAAEIVTGVVQDTDRGVVVGERTYGKGLVQVVSPMPGGGALKLTVAKYYTPSGRCIQAVDYAGGRLEAKGPKPTKVGEAAGGDAAAGELDAPATPPAGGGSVAPEQQQQPAGAKKEEAPERKKNAAGAVLRIDPSEPSMPSASVADANTQFVTKHGRAVTAGGGIAPDVPIEGRTLGELERNLLQRGLFFDFSSEYLRKHPAAPEELARSVERGQDDAYREFVAYVRGRLSGTAGGDKSKALTLETAGLQRIDDLTKSLKGDSHTKSRSELAALRKTLLEEQLEEFRTEKTALQQDLTESLLGRLTPPSVRLAAQLETDPQVAEARRIAADVQRYEKMLEPDPKPLSVIEVVATKSASDRAAAEALVFPL